MDSVARETPARLTRRGRVMVLCTVLALAAAVVTYVVTRTPVGAALGLDVGPQCRLTTSQGAVGWSREQAMTATTVAAVGSRIGASQNGIAAAVTRGLAATADGGAAFLGPQGARAVYRQLPDRARPSAASLATARGLLGVDGPSLTCTLPALTVGDGLAAEPLGPTGLTARASAVRLGMRAAFGRQPLGGFAPGGVSSGHIAGSAHYEGRAIDVFFRPISPTSTRRGWLQAHWAVAHAERLHVATVIFDRQIWSAQRSVSGWRAYQPPGGPTDNVVLLHEDHVHVDVLRGTSG